MYINIVHKIYKVLLETFKSMYQWSSKRDNILTANMMLVNVNTDNKKICYHFMIKMDFGLNVINMLQQSIKFISIVIIITTI